MIFFTRFKERLCLAVLAFAAASPLPALAAELDDTAWRLVEIASMDDSTDVPDDRDRYTLTFNADGTVNILADCNQGTGSWTSERPGGLTFGPIAATQALCPPESIHDVYLAQFPWVRSYVMKDGHLFLATMADGSIIEFEPIEAATEEAMARTARVLDEDLYTDDVQELAGAILTPLLHRYEATNDIHAEEEEIRLYNTQKEQRLRAALGDAYEDSHADLTPQEREELEDMEHDMAASVIQAWKANKALYEQYGGRIIFQQFGPEPLDAYREFLRERQAAGDFEIFDAPLEQAFWRYFTDDPRHSFFEAGTEGEVFARAPWLPAPD